MEAGSYHSPARQNRCASIDGTQGAFSCLLAHFPEGKLGEGGCIWHPNNPPPNRGGWAWRASSLTHANSKP
eukprot:1147353-Pelagomonas_calceolata.AAC.2